MTSKFIKVKCNKCHNEQVIFEKPSTVVKCLVCDEAIAHPSGGRSKMSKENVIGVAE
jgi:small subunit ribosomal protein S27e